MENRYQPAYGVLAFWAVKKKKGIKYTRYLLACVQMLVFWNDVSDNMLCLL